MPAVLVRRCGVCRACCVYPEQPTDPFNMFQQSSLPVICLVSTRCYILLLAEALPRRASPSRVVANAKTPDARNAGSVVPYSAALISLSTPSSITAWTPAAKLLPMPASNGLLASCSNHPVRTHPSSAMCGQLCCQPRETPAVAGKRTAVSSRSQTAALLCASAGGSAVPPSAANPCM